MKKRLYRTFRCARRCGRKIEISTLPLPSPNAKPVVINGKRYNSTAAACTENKIHKSYIKRELEKEHGRSFHNEELICDECKRLDKPAPPPKPPKRKPDGRRVRDRFWAAQTWKLKEFTCPVCNQQRWGIACDMCAGCRERGAKLPAEARKIQGTRKLTVSRVRRIRELAAQGESLHVLARRYDVTQRAIRDIVSGRRWRWVED